MQGTSGTKPNVAVNTGESMRPARLIKELRLERFSTELAKALLARHPEREWTAGS